MMTRIPKGQSQRSNWRTFSALVPFVLVLSYPAGYAPAGSLANGQQIRGTSTLTPLQAEIERQRVRLSSPEAEERRDALMRLRNLNRAEASRAAASGLTDQIPAIRATAAHALIHLPADEAVALLSSLLRDRVEFVRQETAYSLGEIHSRAAVQPLIKALDSDKKNSVRNAAAVALGSIGDESAVVALSGVLTENSAPTDNPTPVRTRKQRKPRARGNQFVLRAAAHSLGQIRSRAGVPALIFALSNDANEPDVRREAAIALGIIGDKSALPALQAAARDNDPYLSRTAYEILMNPTRAKN